MHTVSLPRTCLGFTNIVFFFCGGLCCIICVWCMLNTQFFTDVNYTLTGSSLVTGTANFVNLNLWQTPLTHIFIPLGALTMLTSCCGLFGAGCQIKCAVKSYIFMASILSSVAFWIFFISCVYNIYIKNEKTKRHMQSSIQNYYGNDNDLITQLWNYIMVNYECCGVVNYTDFVNSNWRKSTDKWYPVHCCVLHNKTSVVPVSNGCPGPVGDTHTNMNRGCFEALRKSIIENKGYLIFLIILFSTLYMILVWFSYCIVRGEPLIGAMSKKVSVVKNAPPLAPPQLVQSTTSLENMLFVQEPPQKIVRVVSAVNPFQSYKYTPPGGAYSDYNTNNHMHYNNVPYYNK